MSEKENVYYVYLHRRGDNNEVFYVGKGKGFRSHKKSSRSKWWTSIVDKCGYTIEFVERDITEDDAFDLEIELIKFYRDCGCDLCNFTNGGEGSSGRIVSDETRYKISQANKGKQGNLGRKASDCTKEKMAAARRKPIECSNGMKFESTISAVEWCRSVGKLTATNASISKCLTGSSKTAYGFCWWLTDSNTHVTIPSPTQ